MNSIEQKIDTLANSVSMTRAQIVYAEYLANKIRSMVRSEMHSIHDINHFASNVLKAVVAEAYIEGRSDGFREFENLFMTHKFETPVYGKDTIDDANEYLAGIAKRHER